MNAHTTGTLIVRQQKIGYTLEKCDGELRSILASACDAGICEEHGGTALGNLMLWSHADTMLAALRCVAAALDQPAQTSGLYGPKTCDILRADAAAAKRVADLAIALATGGAK